MNLRCGNMVIPTVVSLFSGAGGMDLGFIKAGYEVIYANDNDKHACATYRENIGNHIVEASIHDIDIDSIPDCDVIIGGPPCQGFSVAGKMSAEDERSQLVYDFADVVSAKMPRAFVMENVDHLGKSPRFEHTRNSLRKQFEKSGYIVKDAILISSDFGVPQRRRRYFMVGILKNETNEPFLPSPNGQIAPTARDILLSFPRPGEPGNERTINAKITLAAAPVMRKSPYAGMLFNGLGRSVDLDRPIQTLAATFGGNKTPVVDERELREEKKPWIIKYHSKLKDGGDSVFKEAPEFLRRLTVDECIAFQDFPRDYILHGPKSAMFRQIGNAVPPGLASAVSRQLRFHFFPILLKMRKLLPIVKSASKRHKRKHRGGRGFTMQELKGAKINFPEARRMGIMVDKRRRSKNEELLAINIARLKEYKAKQTLSL